MSKSDSKVKKGLPKRAMSAHAKEYRAHAWAGSQTRKAERIKQQRAAEERNIAAGKTPRVNGLTHDQRETRRLVRWFGQVPAAQGKAYELAIPDHKQTITPRRTSW